MKRQHALAAIRAHIVKGDTKLAMRVYIEHNTVSYSAYLSAVRDGLRSKNNQNKLGDKLLAATFDGEVVRIV